MQLIVLGFLNTEITKAIEIAKTRGAKVLFAESPEECIDIILKGNSPDLLMVDIYFDIAAIAKSFEEQKIAANIVAYGLNASPKEAVSSIKAGAKEFLPLPPDEEMIAAILETISKQNQNLIYKSESMKQLLKLAEKIAKSDAHVLITGESGTGKEVLARFIHENSNRSKQNYVRVNCAAIPENLIESELFGHEKGAFTGAMARRIGKFEESSNGTLLLDEISEMDIKLQAKLLRAIQEKEIDRLGGQGSVKVNLRIIATSNRDLLSAIQSAHFREDLYFRLNVINIEIPPLRKRRDDILNLANFFIHKYSKANNLETKILDESSQKLLYNHDWPGNIRELENTIHRVVLLTEDKLIYEQDLTFLQNKEKACDSDERALILNTVKYCLGDINQASNILGISIANLSKKLESKVS
ncbi:MAG: sigma-54-dependent Fis family transcriptional regulator [Alphaproteobacteria bacterium]|nr:sigma-54-dependent Fis family transcriptional regulator [Alphaproteobacteria bacterium]